MLFARHMMIAGLHTASTLFSFTGGHLLRTGCWRVFLVSHCNTTWGCISGKLWQTGSIHSTLLQDPNSGDKVRNYFLNPCRVSRGREASLESKSKQVLNGGIVNDQSNLSPLLVTLQQKAW